jgi:hypothetical protein
MFFLVPVRRCRAGGTRIRSAQSGRLPKQRRNESFRFLPPVIQTRLSRRAIRAISPIEVTLEFDELNLDVEMEYEGSRFELATRPPAVDEIGIDGSVIAMAGDLIRQNGDRMRTRSRQNCCILHLHFEHGLILAKVHSRLCRRLFLKRQPSEALASAVEFIRRVQRRNAISLSASEARTPRYRSLQASSKSRRGLRGESLERSP